MAFSPLIKCPLSVFTHKIHSSLGLSSLVSLHKISATYRVRDTAMANPTEWNNRAMFERYLFDYLQKRGLHETAELFWHEANLSFDPSSRPALDVPDGFLHEWWLTFYDMFKASQSKNPVNKEGSSYAVEKVTYVGQQGDPSPLREQEVNKQPIRELTASSDFGLSTGGNLMPFMGCDSMRTEQNFQGLASFEPQQKSSTLAKGFYHPSNLGNISTQGVGPSICATLKAEKIASNESGRKRKHSTCSEDGSNGVPGDEGKTSPSNSRTNHTTTDTNSSIGTTRMKGRPK